MRYKLVALLLLSMALGACDGDGGSSDRADSADDVADVQEDVPIDFDDPEDVAVSDLFATVNPANSLSYYVSWTTDVEATTRLSVDCGEDYQHVVGDDFPRTQHEVFVMGFWDGATCEVVPHPELETTGETQLTLEDIGDLPEQLPELDVKVAQEDKMQPGWTMFSLASASENRELLIVAVDAQGRYRWYYNPGPGNAGSGSGVLVLPDNTLMLRAGRRYPRILSWEGQTLWELDREQHHDMRLSPWNEGHILFLGWGGEGCETREQGVYEMDMETGEDIWTWFVCENYEPRVVYEDWGHLNTIEPVPGEQALLISSRDQDLVFKVNRETGETEWTLGRDGDFDMDPEDYFYRQHTPEVQEDGTILILDNGVTEEEAADTGLDDGEFREHTKVVQYELTFDGEGNPDQANVVWEYVTEDIFALNRSEADRLENGNTLIHYVWVQPDERLILREVTMDKEVVWDVETPPDTSSYRSERVDEHYGYVVE